VATKIFAAVDETSALAQLYCATQHTINFTWPSMCTTVRHWRSSSNEFFFKRCSHSVTLVKLVWAK